MEEKNSITYLENYPVIHCVRGAGNKATELNRLQITESHLDFSVMFLGEIPPD
jgi:hypothetical protein